MEECSISVKGLQKYYGPTHAVDGISFSVNAGELFGFWGQRRGQNDNDSNA